MILRYPFLSSCLASTVLVLGYVAVINHVRTLDLRLVGQDIYVNGQIGTEAVAALSRRGIRTIIAMRPDGEDAAQTPSAVIDREAKDYGMAFVYLPVAHGGIPSNDVVAQLAANLRTVKKPALLFCRTGNRAVRTYALALASDPDGPDEAGILALAVRAGHGVEDLREAIQQRIAARPAAAGAPP